MKTPSPTTELFQTARKRSGMTIRELVYLTGWKRSTIDDHLKSAGTMRLAEAVEIANAMGMTDAEWLAIKNGRR